MRRGLVEILNGLGNKPSFVLNSGLIEAACKHEPYFKLSFQCFLVFFPCMEISLIFCLCFYLLYRRGNNHFDVPFRRIGPVLFPSKDGNDAFRERKNGRMGVYFPPELASFPLINLMIKVLFTFCTLIWRVNNYVSRQLKL